MEHGLSGLAAYTVWAAEHPWVERQMIIGSLLVVAFILLFIFSLMCGPSLKKAIASMASVPETSKKD